MQLLKWIERDASAVFRSAHVKVLSKDTWISSDHLGDLLRGRREATISCLALVTG
jgi:hypothetical protein